ncbi:MAG TPA: LOG family protein [Sedimentisphaerales bacterium]|nr:LOG family protein [Sedimentisphaerales bacterium]
MDKKTIAIFGTSKAKPGDEVFQLAYETGRYLAEAFFDIINGGYGGVMLASARAASLAGGKITGVTCDAFGRSAPNQFITDQINTSCLDERLNTLLEKADAYIVLQGSTGTLLEFAKIWELKNKHFFKSDKPIILIGDFWKPLIEIVATEDLNSVKSLTIVQTPEEAVDYLLKNLR